MLNTWCFPQELLQNPELSPPAVVSIPPGVANLTDDNEDDVGKESDLSAGNKETFVLEVGEENRTNRT